MPRKREPKTASSHDLGPATETAAPPEKKKRGPKKKGSAPPEGDAAAPAAAAGAAVNEGAPTQPPAPPNPYPFANEPAVKGGIIIRCYESTVLRDMTPDDVMAAAEHAGEVSKDYFSVLEHKEATEKKIKRIEEELRDTRGIFRAAEERLMELGGELAEIARQTTTSQRTAHTKVTDTLTLQNEIIVRDAVTGEELTNRRRTATPEETAKGQASKQLALLDPTKTGKAPATPAAATAGPAAEQLDDKNAVKKGKRDTTDSPSPKPDPGDELLAYSISAAAFGKLTEKRQDNLRHIMPDDPESQEKPWLLNWESDPSAERLHIRIPRRLAPKLTLLCYDVDLKKETLQ